MKICLNKICPFRGEPQDESNFVKNKYSKDGLYYHCKTCRHINYINNKDSILKKRDIYRKNNVEFIRERDRELYNIPINKEKRLKRQAKYNKEKRKNDCLYALRKDISRMIYEALKNNSIKKSGSCLKFLFYTIQELKQHIESLWKPGMTWENRGPISNPDCWQIHHKIGQAVLLYDSMEHENFKKCWALENLEPVWSEEHKYIGCLDENGIKYKSLEVEK